MTEINWQDAPAWANWVAMDECGDIYFYEKRPIMKWDAAGGYWDRLHALHKSKYVGCSMNTAGWKESLVQKPIVPVLQEDTPVTENHQSKIDTISTLKTYQSWRRDELDGTLDELNLSPAKIGKAIDEAISLLEVIYECN